MSENPLLPQMKLQPLFLVIAVLLIVACSTNSKKSDEDDRYFEHVEKQTVSSKAYQGFTNVLQMQATLVTRGLAEMQVERKAEQFQWSSAERVAQKEKEAQKTTKSTEVFLSFFTPDNDLDDLSLPKSLWRIYLDVGGVRYEGRVQKVSGTVTEIQNLFPGHNRWSTPYQISFIVPTDIVESQKAKLVVTGPMATEELQFP